MGEGRFWFRGADYRVLEGKEGVRQAYDEMADRYDESKYLYWTRRMEECEERAVEGWMAMLSPPVLDVGSGTGRYAIKMAMRGLEVVALDLSLNMLRKMLEKARGLGIYGKVSPVLADGERMPFRDCCFPGLISALAFGHFTDPETAAGEFSRVLKIGGLCIVTTLNSYTLDRLRRMYGIPANKAPFRTEDMEPTLIYEAGCSAGDLGELFGGHGLGVVEAKGCCYWHLLLLVLLGRHGSRLDSLFNKFRRLLKYAEIHAVLMRKSWRDRRMP